jgi:hypothetical protein
MTDRNGFSMNASSWLTDASIRERPIEPPQSHVESPVLPATALYVSIFGRVKAIDDEHTRYEKAQHEIARLERARKKLPGSEYDHPDLYDLSFLEELASADTTGIGNNVPPLSRSFAPAMPQNASWYASGDPTMHISPDDLVNSDQNIVRRLHGTVTAGILAGSEEEYCSTTSKRKHAHDGDATQTVDLSQLSWPDLQARSKRTNVDDGDSDESWESADRARSRSKRRNVDADSDEDLEDINSSPESPFKPARKLEKALPGSHTRVKKSVLSKINPLTSNSGAAQLRSQLSSPQRAGTTQMPIPTLEAYAAWQTKDRAKQYRLAELSEQQDMGKYKENLRSQDLDAIEETDLICTYHAELQIKRMEYLVGMQKSQSKRFNQEM